MGFQGPFDQTPRELGIIFSRNSDCVRLPSSDIHNRRALSHLSGGKRRVPSLITHNPQVPILAIPTPIQNPIIIHKKARVLTCSDTYHILILKSANFGRRLNAPFLRNPALEIRILAPGPHLTPAINHYHMRIPTGNVGYFFIETFYWSGLMSVRMKLICSIIIAIQWPLAAHKEPAIAGSEKSIGFCALDNIDECVCDFLWSFVSRKCLVECLVGQTLSEDWLDVCDLEGRVCVALECDLLPVGVVCLDLGRHEDLINV